MYRRKADDPGMAAVDDYLLAPMNRLLESQARLHKAEKQLRSVMEGVRKLEAKIAELKEAHRAQIALSLTAKDPEERQMAASISTWWEVPVPMEGARSS